MLLFQFPEAEELLRRDDWALLREWTATHPELDDALETLADVTTARSTGTGRTCTRAASSSRRASCRRCRRRRSGSGAAATSTCSSDQMTGSAARRRQWRYERIDGASHWMQLDAPDRVNELLLELPGVTTARRAAGGVRRAASSPPSRCSTTRRRAPSSARSSRSTLERAREEARARRAGVRARRGAAAGGADARGQGPLRHRRAAHHLRLARSSPTTCRPPTREAVRRAARGRRDRGRQDAHARVRVGHHERQPALPAVPQPVRPRARRRRVERRLGGRAGHRPGGARAGDGHRRLDPDPRVVLRRLAA